MKKGLSKIFFFICIMLLCACGKQGDEQRDNESYEEEKPQEITVAMEETGEDMETEANTEMSEKRMTREYIIEQNLFTEEELKGVDVEAILEEWKWKEGDENRKTWRNIFLIEIENQKIAAGIIKTIDYSYLGKLGSREIGLTEEEFESIKTISLQHNAGNCLTSILLDKANGKMYFGEACDLLVPNTIPPVTMDMGEETWDTIMELLESCHVTEWKKSYQGINEEDSTGNFWWGLSIELENGERCYYSGEGTAGSNQPEQYRELERGMRELFEISE